MIIVSKQIFLRKSLASFLDTLSGFHTVGETSCYRAALELAEQHNPALVLADIELPKAELEIIANQLTDNLPMVSLLLFGNLSSKNRLLEFIPLNAQGYLTTELETEVFIRLLQDAANGITAISPSILDEVLEKLRFVLTKEKTNSNPKRLTSREKEVLHQLISGSTNREIARSLVISECTVKNHIHNMLEKLKVENRSKLISHVLTKNLISH